MKASLFRRTLFQARDLRFLARGVRVYAPRRTPPVRDALWHAIALAHPVTYIRRRRALREIPPTGAPAIPENVGVLSVDRLPGVEAAVEEARDILGTVDLDAWRAREPANQLFTVFLGDRLDRDSAILRLALHPSLVRAVGQYLGMVPVLKDAIILYSPNDVRTEGSAQFLHLDGQDRRMIQVFVYLDDVDRDCGPLTAVAADVSRRLARRIKYRKTAESKRVSDDEAATDVPPSAVHVLTGRAGSAQLVDTDRCFHYGSREGTRPRMALVLQYYTPFAFQLPPGGTFPFAVLVRADDGDVERMVLGASR